MMTKLLNLKTSLFGDGSVSNEPVNEFLQLLVQNQVADKLNKEAA